MDVDCDFILSPRPLLQHSMCFGVSYFVSDVFTMFLVARASHRERLDWHHHLKAFLQERPLIVAHHLVLPLIG